MISSLCFNIRSTSRFASQWHFVQDRSARGLKVRVVRPSLDGTGKAPSSTAAEFLNFFGTHRRVHTQYVYIYV